ncbi:MAG TPA: hypothetical protein VFU72_10800, partial [Nitrolancea sp.]|nr:hypothetical protein [Nitrolancea sp.]
GGISQAYLDHGYAAMAATPGAVCCSSCRPPSLSPCPRIGKDDFNEVALLIGMVGDDNSIDA